VRSRKTAVRTRLFNIMTELTQSTINMNAKSLS